MTAARSVQYTTKAGVLLAYDETNIPAFAIFHNGQRMYRYQDNDIEAGREYLDKILTVLTEAQSAAIYTIALYEFPKSRKKDAGIEIGPKREPDLSFNFRFQSIDGAMGGPGTGGGMGVAAILAEIRQENKELRKELEALRKEREEEEDNDDSDPAGGLGDIGELLKNPVVMDLITGLLSGNKALPGKPAAMAGTDPASEATRLQRAIEILAAHDPDIVTHLEKLARVAEKNPKKFSGLISMMDML